MIFPPAGSEAAKADWGCPTPWLSEGLGLEIGLLLRPGPRLCLEIEMQAGYQEGRGAAPRSLKDLTLR